MMMKLAEFVDYDVVLVYTNKDSMPEQYKPLDMVIHHENYWLYGNIITTFEDAYRYKVVVLDVCNLDPDLELL